MRVGTRRRAAAASAMVGLVLWAAGCQQSSSALPPTGAPSAEVLPTSAPLPGDVIAFDSDRTGHFELFTMPGGGGQATQITEDPAYDSWSPRVSPDRRTILFHRAPAGTHDRDHAQVSVWAVAAAGGDPVQLRPVGADGWQVQGHAEWSPDGRNLVLFGGARHNPQLYVTDNLGGNARAITSRTGVSLDPAYHPDGRRVGFVGCPRAVCFEADYEIYVLDLDSGKTTRVTNDRLRDHDPYWSPSGDTMAWLTAYGGSGLGVWDVRLGDGHGRSPRRLFGDDGVTSRPAFAPDGRYVYVHRIAPGGAAFQVYRVDLSAPGKPLVVTAGQPGSNEYPSP